MPLLTYAPDFYANHLTMCQNLVMLFPWHRLICIYVFVNFLGTCKHCCFYIKMCKFKNCMRVVCLTVWFVLLTFDLGVTSVFQLVQLVNTHQKNKTFCTYFPYR